MALSPTLRALKLSFDRYFGHEHDGKFHGPYCCWAEYSEGGQHIRCEELASQRHGAFKGTFNAHDLEDEVNLFRVPKGIYGQAFCDDHQEAYQDLLRERLKEIHQLCDSLSRSASPGSEVSHETSGSETDHDHDACQEDKPFDDDYGNSDADQDDESDNEEVLSKNDLSSSRKACVNIFSNGSWELVDSSTHGLKGPVPAVGAHNDAPNNRTAGNAEPAQAPLLEAKEVHPMPLRTISADLWQLRWPLACSVTFALQSPYMPPALSFVMWSIFLPFFVAELRTWNGKGQK